MLTPTDYQALADFRFQIRRFLSISEQLARKAGMEPRQHQLLLAIKGQRDGQATTIGELAARMLVRHHTAVELIDRAEANGLVVRRRDTADRRAVHVELTAQGEALLQDLSRCHRLELESTGPALIAALQSLGLENAGSLIGAIE